MWLISSGELVDFPAGSVTTEIVSFDLPSIYQNYYYGEIILV